MHMHRTPGGRTTTSLSGGLSSTQQPPSHVPSVAPSLRDDDYGIPILQLSTDTKVGLVLYYCSLAISTNETTV